MLDSSGSQYEEQHLLLQYLALFTFAAGAAALAYGLPLYDKTPYLLRLQIISSNKPVLMFSTE